MIDISKHNRAIIAINKWKGNRGVGTFEHVTGFGKTREGLLLCKEILSKYPDANILIVTPSIAVKDVWLSYFDKEDEYLEFSDAQKARFIIDSASMILNNLDDLTHMEFKLVIFDEIHKFTSPERYRLFGELTYTSILGLTGTYPMGLNKTKLDKYCPVIDIISETEALSQNWISQFIEYNIACTLTDTDKERYEKFSEPIYETLELFRGMHKRMIRQDGNFLFKDDYQCIQSCKSGLKTRDLLGNSLYLKGEGIRQTIAAFMEWSPQLDLSTSFGKERDEVWNPNNIKTRVENFTDFVKKRNGIIINNTVKLDKVVEIYKMFPNKTICFNESTDFADAVANVINANSSTHVATTYHSNIESRAIWDDQLNDYFRYGSGAKKGEPKIFGKTTLRDIAINGLREGTYSFLSTARALDEGLDIPSLEQVITTAGTANPIQYAQRGGRGKRIDAYNPNKVTKIFNLYFEDFIGSNGNLIHSRDKQKLISNQRERGSNVVWLSDLSDISEAQIS